MKDVYKENIQFLKDNGIVLHSTFSMFFVSVFENNKIAITVDEHMNMLIDNKKTKQRKVVNIVESLLEKKDIFLKEEIRPGTKGTIFKVKINTNYKNNRIKIEKMKKQVIKKGRKSICHLPKFANFGDTYTQKIKIHKSMLSTDDSCDSGWSKLWGIALGHIHWNNSYRFVYRVKNGKLIIGYYAYIGGVSPQKNKDQKGNFEIDVKVGDELEMYIDFVEGGATLELVNLTNNYRQHISFPSPKGWKFPRTYCFPNIKCDATENIYYDFY